MELEIMLNKMNQIKKDKYHVFSHLQELDLKKKMDININEELLGMNQQDVERKKEE
jgi:hypothetical protein